MRMKIKRALVSALCLALCLCLCGCVAGVDALNKTSSVTLPPAQVEYAAVCAKRRRHAPDRPD